MGASLSNHETVIREAALAWVGSAVREDSRPRQDGRMPHDRACVDALNAA